MLFFSIKGGFSENVFTKNSENSFPGDPRPLYQVCALGARASFAALAIKQNKQKKDTTCGMEEFSLQSTVSQYSHHFC